jgi:hypothetical protein
MLKGREAMHPLFIKKEAKTFNETVIKIFFSMMK